MAASEAVSARFRACGIARSVLSGKGGSERAGDDHELGTIALYDAALSG
jgi:hypothetical protein